MSNAFTEAAPGVGFIGYMCAGTKGGIAQQAYTTYAGQTSAMTFTTTTVLFLEPLSGDLTNSSTSSTSSSSTLSSSPSSPSSSSLVSPTTTGSPTTSSTSAAPTAAVPVGPIVGGVVGGVGALVAVASGIYFWRRNRRDPVKTELHKNNAYVAQDFNAQLPVQELGAPELPQKNHVTEVLGDHPVYEIMGSQTYR
jgi:hypothetical protein